MKRETEFLDLREQCRGSDKWYTEIQLQLANNPGIECWMKLGEIRITRPKIGGLWNVQAYLGGHTDGEHDSAYLLSFTALSIELASVAHGSTNLTGYINPCGDAFTQFNIPTREYDPLKNAKDCTRCGESHKIVYDEDYIPPHNAELFEQLRGRQIWIQTMRSDWNEK